MFFLYFISLVLILCCCSPPGVEASRHLNRRIRLWRFTSPHRHCGRYCTSNNSTTSYSSPSSYRKLEEFVLRELDRQDNAAWTGRHSILSDISGPAQPSATASTTPRGGGNVSTVKGPLLNTPAVPHSVTHSFWTSSHSHDHTSTADLLINTPILLHANNRTQPNSLLLNNRTDSTSLHHAYARRLQNRNSLNINRKITHAAFGLFFAAMNQIIPKATFLPYMTIVTLSTLLMEMVRYRKGFGWINYALHFVLGKSLRKHEMEGKFTGSFYYFLGVTLTSYLFPTPCASLGICQLALADPAASYFGRLTRDVSWSRIQQGIFGMGRNKGILGFIMGAIFCVPFNYRILSLATINNHQGMVKPLQDPTKIGLISLSLGLAGALADLCVPSPALSIPFGPSPRFHVDDNLMVPLFAGYACTQVFRMVGWTHVQLSPWLFL